MTPNCSFIGRIVALASMSTLLAVAAEPAALRAGAANIYITPP